MNGPISSAITLAVGVVGAGLALLRWLRVAQREHYLPGSASRFASRWWAAGRVNPALAVLAVGCLGGGVFVTPVALASALVICVGPWGLGIRGSSSPLVWTPRLRLLAGVAAVAAGVVVGAVAIAGLRPAAVGACLVAAVMPLLVDGALVATRPVERRRLQPYLKSARIKLAAARPTVVAITGSYGKTSTKGYVAHLVSASRTVVPTPRSFNNQAGLATAINQHLTPGTEVFIAEMGTYGRGEIAELCRLVPPHISVITAIGPVHLERMGSEENIAAAKAEILAPAPVVVLNTDHRLLADLADRAQVDGKKVWRCSARGPADVVVEEQGEDLIAHLGGGHPAVSVRGVHAAPTNVACAIAVALELGVPAATVADRLPSLPVTEHRQAVTQGRNGQAIVDDTYNSNPAGARAALRLLGQLASSDGAKRVVVTPGMIELGHRQGPENASFAREAAQMATHLVIVGQTNAAALLKGSRDGAAEVVRARSRTEAVAWVAANTGPGDAVLYENDLPDHFP
ncbi:MAG TPA: UDP-N-acetylmuramoyl-tripeptide--D-alanyl-D-alanine ligase [Acidimicrobiales bacterium]|nr:UDP-N-acetylmuramoyl-tripeptide--D-alanyl-D-alanine ligase [Acidimicrobiales bacterium]